MNLLNFISQITDNFKKKYNFVIGVDEIRFKFNNFL